jgi:hypothetical protein
MAAKTVVSTPSIKRIFKTNQWHPYKLQMLQTLNEYDPDRSIEFCRWALHWEEGNASCRKPWFSVMRPIWYSRWG